MFLFLFFCAALSLKLVETNIDTLKLTEIKSERKARSYLLPLALRPACCASYHIRSYSITKQKAATNATKFRQQQTAHSHTHTNTNTRKQKTNTNTNLTIEIY